MSGQVVVEGAPHLGGYVAGGDEATWYPILWRWLVEGPLAVRSVLDVGCGDGAALRYFRELGCFARGVDGVPQEDDAIVQHDFTEGPADTVKLRLLAAVQVVWCCEFVEHVEEAYVENFLPSLTHGMHVLLTHAEPGQQGHHHVNCQPASYWRHAMASVGYVEDEELTRITRALARTNTSPWNHYARSGMAFERAAG